MSSIFLLCVLALGLSPDPCPSVTAGSACAQPRHCAGLEPLEGDKLELGERPHYEFTEMLFNGPAMRSLRDFRERPLLVMFYSSRCGSCTCGAVPSLLELQSKYGEQLQVLFVEAWVDSPRARSFALEHGWLSSRAMWTSENPFEMRGLQVPTAVLLSGTGEIVLTANPLARKRELEQAVEREVAIAASVPEEVPEALHPAWTQYRQGKIGQAIRLAEREAQAEDVDPQVASAAAVALKTFRERGSSQIDWIERLIETGHYVRAEALTETLRAGVHGDQDLQRRLDQVSARLEAPELKRERQAAHALVEIENELLLGGARQPTIERLERFLVQFEGTRAAQRARQLRDLATLI